MGHRTELFIGMIQCPKKLCNSWFYSLVILGADGISLTIFAKAHC